MTFFLQRTAILLLICIGVSSCGGDRIIDDREEVKVDETIKWIEDILNSQYLYSEDITNTPDYNQEPEDFFKSLLSDKDGKIRDGVQRYYSTIEEYNPSKSSSFTETYGYKPALLSKDGVYYIKVMYVLPNSPAEESGLVRGDWIVGFDGKVGNITDYELTESGSAVEFTLGNYMNDGTFEKRKDIQMPASRLVEDTPFLCDTVIHEGQHAVGYLLYNHFTRGIDPYDYTDITYDIRLVEIMEEFKAQNVTDVVLDLRYNGGGLVSSAQKLTTMLAPKNAQNDIFCILRDNGKSGEEELKMYLRSEDVDNVNLDLSRLYVLVSASTASSSELVINSLIPYMGRENIILIGEKTEGKAVVSSRFGVDENYGYLLNPLTHAIFNKDGEADYQDGFEQDIYAFEYEASTTLYPFGDQRELMLSLALDHIIERGEVQSRKILSKQGGEILQHRQKRQTMLLDF